jgi:hypothetical protein
MCGGDQSHSGSRSPLRKEDAAPSHEPFNLKPSTLTPKVLTSNPKQLDHTPRRRAPLLSPLGVEISAPLRRKQRLLARNSIQTEYDHLLQKVVQGSRVWPTRALHCSPALRARRATRRVGVAAEEPAARIWATQEAIFLLGIGDGEKESCGLGLEWF